MKNLLAFIALSLAWSASYALTISGCGINGLGCFEAEADYDASTGILSVEMRNTSTDGFLTAFAFNNPGSSTSADGSGAISSASLLAPGAWNLLGESSGGNLQNNGINAQPFGQFDIGASTDPREPFSWEGGGNPTLGIAAGDSLTFQFQFSGENVSSVSLLSLFGDGTGANPGELSEPPISEDYAAQIFAVRFRGFECEDLGTCEGSDKAPGVVPIPPALGLFIMGLGFLGVLGRRKRKVA